MAQSEYYASVYAQQQQMLQLLAQQQCIPYVAPPPPPQWTFVPMGPPPPPVRNFMDLCRSSHSLAHRRHSYLPLEHRTIRKEVERCMASSTRYSRTQLWTEAAAKAPTTLATAVRECASISTFSIMNTSYVHECA
ncbi:hypothetical protein ZEAMMB73_Zm00001d030006 [Zea mays]|nr:hypothetical protein ZEAMMB73_Zm00001d030006 [Zea mays]